MQGQYFKVIVLINKKFGFLTVIGKSTNNGNGIYKIKCLCDCGKEHLATTSKVKSGRTTSCGCKRVKHGLYGTPEYRVWGAMMQRCSNPNAINYHSYGGRGISVCKSWHKFEAFIKDMGKRPSKKHSIDRLDNDGNYTPENCEWRTTKQQRSNTSRNVFYTYKGETLTARQWSERIGGSKNIFDLRVNKLGWSIEDAITTPVKKKAK